MISMYRAVSLTLVKKICIIIIIIIIIIVGMHQSQKAVEQAHGQLSLYCSVCFV